MAKQLALRVTLRDGWTHLYPDRIEVTDTPVGTTGTAPVMEIDGRRYGLHEIARFEPCLIEIGPLDA